MDYPAIIAYKYPLAQFHYDDGAGITLWDDAAPKPTLSQLRGYAEAQAYADHQKKLSDRFMFQSSTTVGEILDALIESADGDSTKLDAIIIEHRKTR